MEAIFFSMLAWCSASPPHSYFNSSFYFAIFLLLIQSFLARYQSSSTECIKSFFSFFPENESTDGGPDCLSKEKVKEKKKRFAFNLKRLNHRLMQAIVLMRGEKKRKEKGKKLQGRKKELYNNTIPSDEIFAASIS